MSIWNDSPLIMHPRTVSTVLSCLAYDPPERELIRVLNLGPAGEHHSAKAEHQSCNDLQRYKAHKDSGLIATKLKHASGMRKFNTLGL